MVITETAMIAMGSINRVLSDHGDDSSGIQKIACKRKSLSSSTVKTVIVKKAHLIYDSLAREPHPRLLSRLDFCRKLNSYKVSRKW